MGGDIANRAERVIMTMGQFGNREGWPWADVDTTTQ